MDPTHKSHTQLYVSYGTHICLIYVAFIILSNKLLREVKANVAKVVTVLTHEEGENKDTSAPARKESWETLSAAKEGCDIRELNRSTAPCHGGCTPPPVPKVVPLRYVSHQRRESGLRNPPI